MSEGNGPEGRVSSVPPWVCGGFLLSYFLVAALSSLVIAILHVANQPAPTWLWILAGLFWLVWVEAIVVSSGYMDRDLKRWAEEEGWE